MRVFIRFKSIQHNLANEDHSNLLERNNTWLRRGNGVFYYTHIIPAIPLDTWIL